MKSFFRQHQQAFVWSINQWRIAPGFHLMITLTLTMSLLIPISLYTLMHNTQQIHQPWQYHQSAVIYLKPYTATTQLNKIITQLSHLKTIQDFTITSSAQGLKKIAQLTQIPQLTQWINPAVVPIMIQLKFPKKITNQAITTTTNTLQKHYPDIEAIRLHQRWTKQMHHLINALQYSLVFILIIVVWLIGMTIHCSIKQLRANQKSYITLLKLLGASERFIRRHFHYFSLQMMLSSALIATYFSNKITQWLLHEWNLINPSSLMHQTTTISFEHQYLYILILSYLIGTAASYYATKKFIRKTS